MEILGKATPLMQQYVQIKQQYLGVLLLFQVGDFYELFFEDAKQASSFLGIALTKRGNVNGEPIPLCGVPVHARDHYITKLVKGGFKVALCDQLEEARPGILVKRGVTQVLTPGTLTDDRLLDSKTSSYLLSFFPTEHALALVCGELLAAQLMATVLPASASAQLETELLRFFPDEIVLCNTNYVQSYQNIFKKYGYRITLVDLIPDEQPVQTWLTKQHISLSEPALVSALALFQHYIYKNQKMSLDQFDTVHLYKPEQFLIVDAVSQRNLELVRNNYDGSRSHTLLSVLDEAQTPMGSRMLTKWVLKPLVQKEAIIERQTVIAWASEHIVWRKTITSLLSEIGDLERVVGRIGLSRAQFNDYVLLKQALTIIPTLQAHLIEEINTFSIIRSLLGQFADFGVLYQLLQASLNDDLSKPGIIKSGFDFELDRLRSLIENGAAQIVAFECAEQTKTGINSLKVRYNKQQGYFIEITKTNKDLVPAAYIFQQSLAGRERFTTSELQTLQQSLLNAQTDIERVEQEIFERIKYEVSVQVSALRRMAHACATLDALMSLATVAYNNMYCKPEMVDYRDLLINEGRHPVVERFQTQRFIVNDTSLTDEQSLWIITGPNMGGKSTYLRQVALIALMAHMGSLVPAKSAVIPILDRIFTRIGASDYVAHGKSTFLVEMEETATICNEATERSLVVLDEIGRGTSTYDGMAIAWAVAQYIHLQLRSRCLFATHYHELTELREQFSGVGVYYAASQRTRSGIVLLYKILQGVADGSFGLEVAKMAGLPQAIIEESQLLVGQFHQQERKKAPALDEKYRAAVVDLSQYHALEEAYRSLEDSIQELRQIDYDHLSPKQAFDLLWKIRYALNVSSSKDQI